MINLKSLIDFLPPIFKNTDTYKVEGKGILERFLEVCGEYLEDDITPDIENTLDIINIKNIDPLYLNYLWELLGEIPFGSNMAIDKDQWDRYYDGTLSKEELTQLSKNWVIPKEGIISLDETQIRTLLKYSLTLLKIRGTKKFFETLFKIYGIGCTITEVDGYDKGLYAKLTRTDYSSNIDDITTDTHQQCDECLTININISTRYYYSDKYGLILMGSDEVFFMGKNNYISIDTMDGVELYNKYTPDSIPDDRVNEWKGFIEFRRVIEQLFDKYLPCNVTPHITYSGVLPDDRVSVDVQYLTDQHITNENPIVKIKVLVTSTYSRSGNKFYVSKDSINWSSKTFDSGHIFNIEDEGDLYFKSVDTPSSLDYITVVKNITQEPPYRLVVTGTEPSDSSYNSISTPVLWVFENGPSPNYVQVSLMLFRGNQIVPSNEVFISVNGGPAEGIVDKLGSTNFIKLPVGDNRISWVDNPDVYLDIKVLRAYPLSSGEELNPPKPKFRGLPYGVSGSFSQLEYYKENGVVKQKHTQLGVFGNYGAVGTPENPLGNVVTLGCTIDGAYNMEAIVTNLKPWAYQYNKLNGTVEPIEGLTKVDILYCNNTVNVAYLDEYFNNNPGQVKDNLQATDIFYKASTITVTPSGVINLTEYMADPGFFIRGGIILLHPNTEELISKGLTPNSGTNSEFYSNFLVVVIPSIDSEYKDGTTSIEVGFKYTEFSRKYQEYRDSKDINQSGRVRVSEYKRGDTGRDDITPLIYNYISVEESGYTSDHKITNRLSVETKGSGINPPDETTYLGLTKVLVLNNKGYSSLKNEYIADPIPSKESIESYPVLFHKDTMDLSDFYWDYLERVNLIFIDCWAPFMNTQLMVRKYKPSGITDGLYLKPMLDIPEEDIINLSEEDFKNKYPGFPWNRSQVIGYLIDPTVNGLRVLETDGTKDTFRSISVNTVYNIASSTGVLHLQNTIITPVKFQFVVYKDGEEWDRDYYLVDSSGVKYLPNRTYEIRDLGITNFKVVPNLTRTSISPIGNSQYTPSFHEVRVVNGKLTNGSYPIVKQELKLTKPKCIINSTKPGRKILVWVRQVYPVLNSYQGVGIYKVITEGSTDTILSEDLVEQLPLEISNPGTYSFILKDLNTGMSISDIVRLEITDPYQTL